MKKQANDINKHVGGGGGAVYGLGLIGALVYNLQQAVSFAEVIFGILKALAWPAFLVYDLLEFLNI